MPITGIEAAIIATGILSQCLLLIVWFFRGRQRPFWSVGLYVFYRLTFTILMRVFHIRRRALGDWNYLDDAVDFMLLASVVLESFFFTVRRHAASLSMGRKYWFPIGAVGILFAVVLVMSLRFAGLTNLEVWKDRIDMLSSLVLCTLLLTSAWITARLRARRTAPATAICRGLAVWAIFALVVDLAHMNAMWSSSLVFDQFVSASWVPMILYWAYTIWLGNRSDSDMVVPSL